MPGLKYSSLCSGLFALATTEQRLLASFLAAVSFAYAAFCAVVAGPAAYLAATLSGGLHSELDTMGV